jgi:hypothetical protein
MSSDRSRIGKGVPTGGQFKSERKTRVAHPNNMFERACAEYRSLKSRKTNPPGHFRNGIFHLDERFACCDKLTPPTPSEPYVEVRHGRSAEHISAKYGVPEADILFGREY